jgi:L-2-hydroxyglutarate oxidase
VEAGPNAVLAFAPEGYRKRSFRGADVVDYASFPGFWIMAAKYARVGAEEYYRSWSKAAFVRSLQKLVPELTADDLVPGGAGVRAQALGRDGSLIDDFRFAYRLYRRRASRLQCAVSCCDSITRDCQARG